MSLFSTRVRVGSSGRGTPRGRRELIARAWWVALAGVGFAFGGSRLHAQERIPLPPPDPAPPGIPGRLPASDLPAPSTSPVGQNPPPFPIPSTGGNTPPAGPDLPPSGPGPYPPGPYPPGPYPPGGYGPPPPGSPYGPPGPYYRRPTRVYQGDPVNNPEVWIGVESLVWWSKRQPQSVPLLTTGPASQGSNAGNLGAPGTVTLGGPIDYGTQGGVRFFVGGWFDPEHRLGVEGSMFFLGRTSSGYGATDRAGTGDFVINEPLAGGPFFTQVSAPGIETGSAVVGSSTRFWGADVDALLNISRGPRWSLSAFAGFRYLDLNESLGVASSSDLFTTTTYSDNLGNTLATAGPGSNVVVVDQFSARNQFYGGAVGIKGRYAMNRWFFEGAGSVALGGTHEVLTVNGSTNIYPANGNPVTLQGGNYATLQTGYYAINRFAVAPQLQLNVGYQFTPFLRGTIGYSFTYLSSVLRPGNQVDNVYDGVSRPTVPLTSTGYWAQGLNFGLQFSY